MAADFQWKAIKGVQFSLCNKYDCSLFLVRLHCMSLLQFHIFFFNIYKFWLTTELKKSDWNWDVAHFFLLEIPLTLNRPAETPVRDIFCEKSTSWWPTDTVQATDSSLFHFQHVARTKTRSHPPARTAFSKGKSLAVLALPSFFWLPPLCSLIKSEVQLQADKHVRTWGNRVIWGCQVNDVRWVYVFTSVIISPLCHELGGMPQFGSRCLDMTGKGRPVLG